MCLKKIMLATSVLLACGTVFSCVNTISSVNLCGTVFTFCSPADWVNVWYPVLEVPDFNADPSCTIPLGCGDGDLLPPLDGGPGGGAPEPAGEAGGTGLGGGGI